MCDPHGDASKNNEKIAKSPLLGDSGHLFAPVLSRSHTSFLEVPETCRPILTSPMFREIFGRFLSTSLAPFFWALSGQIFLTVRRQEKKKENIPDGANKGNAREVVGEGGSAGFLDRRPSPRKRPNGYEHYEVIRRAHPS